MIDSHETERGRIGRLGEEAVVRFLRGAGYEICARNWRSGAYELDIVARRHEVLHLIEVKTRQAGALTTPEEALTPTKIRSLHRAARLYVGTYARRYEGYEWQFDLASVLVTPEGTMQVELIERVAECSW
ncbi:MAG: YraN family protein [Alistipes sp.]|nr:YraN family protein [Alistipes sp.]